jgi:ABC-type oligopeptide transport system substrate-binding subunit
MGIRAHGAEIIDDIQGEQAFLDGDAERIEGLRVERNRLTITLMRPSGSFLARLSMPLFCPVPTDSPFVDGGAVTKLPGAAGSSMVASAGPYYLADSFNGEYQILKRNPNYGGARPQGLDAIALREGIDPGAAIGRVQDGSWDGIMNLFDGSLSPYGTLATGGDPNAEGVKYRAVPLPGLDYLALNASRPLFRSRDVRRAVALALDRTAVARSFDEITTTILLPPPLSDRSTEGPAPDLDAARRLIGNANLKGVIASYAGCDPCRAVVEAVRSSLARIGIRMTIREVPDPVAEAAKPGSDIDLFNAFRIQDYADAASFLRGELTEAMPESWLPPGVADAVRRLDGLRAPERDAAAQHLADRLAADQIPVVAFGSGSAPSYLSPRLGCQVFPPYGFGVDLAALCLDASSA